MTEKSHKKRFLGVIYEIIDGGVALGDVQGTWETPDSVFGEGVPLTVAGDRGRGREGGFVSLCTFYMLRESVHLKLFHHGF